MLRLLQDQEEHFILSDKSASDAITGIAGGIRASVGRNNFVSYCSNGHLCIAFVPGWLRKYLRPKSVIEYAETKPNIKKLRSIHSLVDSAQKAGYIEYGRQKDEGGESKEQKSRIRISDSGDAFANYFDGLETFVKRYPYSLSVVFVSIIPWIITNHHWIKTLFVRVF